MAALRLLPVYWHNLKAIGQFGPSPFVDFNGDGLTDIAAFNTLNGFGPFLNNGTGSFVGPPSATTAPADQLSYNLSVYGDFNGDGRADWVAATGGGGVYELGNGDGSFRSFGSLSGAGLAIGDVDGDGCTDVIVLQSGGNQIVPLLSLGGYVNPFFASGRDIYR